MTNSEKPGNETEEDLETIHKSLVKSIQDVLDYLHELIEVEEYSLALDEMAAWYIASGQQPSPENLRLIDALATRMAMQDGDQYRAVAQLRKVSHP